LPWYYYVALIPGSGITEMKLQFFLGGAVNVFVSTVKKEECGNLYRAAAFLFFLVVFYGSMALICFNSLTLIGVLKAV